MLVANVLLHVAVIGLSFLFPSLRSLLSYSIQARLADCR